MPDRETVLALKSQGLTDKQVGERYGLSRRRIQQIRDPDYRARHREYMRKRRESRKVNNGSI